jgi:deoxyhypusine synthase
MAQKKDFLKEVIQHIDIKKHNVVPFVDAMENMAFTARDLNRASRIYDMMLKDKNCGIILTLAGSLFSAGLKKIVYDMIMNNMVDALFQPAQS